MRNPWTTPVIGGMTTDHRRDQTTEEPAIDLAGNVASPQTHDEEETTSRLVLFRAMRFGDLVLRLRAAIDILLQVMASVECQTRTTETA